MSKCFVIQVFDEGGAYDKRFEDVYAPAIGDAGLEAYRVDRDRGTSIPVADIESGIRDARLCLADISEDNPNVWFELGYAIASAKEVVLLCSDKRETKFPFDVQHRTIIRYVTESARDFSELRKQIAETIKARLKKQEAIECASSPSPIREMEGLSQHEMVALVTVAQYDCIAPGGVSGWQIQQDMRKVGFTDIAISLALKSLGTENYIESRPDTDFNNNEFFGYSVTKKGVEWLTRNEDRLVLRQDSSSEAEEDDLPF